ncbi:MULTISPECIES: hypothetical protein [Nocardia]|uniref:hypothetical protein n=1 Tax=Nocardia TaxID=1817 RepID=UPI001358F2AF|nr:MULTISPECIES: hypothetical protein [Nocardia]
MAHRPPDISIRDATAADLYVRDEVPSLEKLERLYAAFYNPNISIDRKVEVSYGGDKVRPVVEQAMSFSQTFDWGVLPERRLRGRPAVRLLIPSTARQAGRNGGPTVAVRWTSGIHRADRARGRVRPKVPPRPPRLGET